MRFVTCGRVDLFCQCRASCSHFASRKVGFVASPQLPEVRRTVPSRRAHSEGAGICFDTESSLVGGHL